MAELYDGTVERLFAYDGCANVEVGARLSPAAPARAVRILTHIGGAQWLWLQRLLGGSPVVVWPEWTIEQCRKQFEALRYAWREAHPRIDIRAGLLPED